MYFCHDKLLNISNMRISHVKMARSAGRESYARCVGHKALSLGIILCLMNVVCVADAGKASHYENLPESDGECLWELFYIFNSYYRSFLWLLLYKLFSNYLIMY